MKKTRGQKMLEEVEKQLDIALTDKGLMVFPTFAIALKRKYDWDRTKIIECLKAVSKAFSEWEQEKTGKCMIQICEEKTELSVAYTQDKLWDDVSFLKTDWKEKFDKMHFRNMEQQYLFAVHVRTEQIRWIEPTLYASIFVAMHDIHGYEYEDCLMLRDLMNEINSECCKEDLPKKCFEETKVRIEVEDGCFRYDSE